MLLVGAGALAFAKKLGFKEQELLSPEVARRVGEEQAHEARREQHDTVCCIGDGRRGNLASAVSTSGLPNKLAGRVGDSPIIGAGSYVDNDDRRGARRPAIGELAIKNAASFAIVERMRAGSEPTRACEEILDARRRSCIPKFETTPTRSSRSSR